MGERVTGSPRPLLLTRVTVSSLRLSWYCEQTPALAWPGRRLKHLAESKDRGAFGP